MKKIAILIILILPINYIYAQYWGMCRMGEGVYFPQGYQCNNNPWILVFEDDFGGTNFNPTDDWFEEQPWGDYDPPKAVTLPKNAILDGNGNLLLRVIPDHDWYNSSWDTQNPIMQEYYYSCASIWTKKYYKYGKFEIRCKIPSGHGLTAAFWLYSENPIWKEIDDFEFYASNTNQPHMNVHWDLNGDGSMSTEPPNSLNIEECPENYTGPDFSAGMHTFTLIWEPTKIEFYVDGVLRRFHSKYYNDLGQPVNCEDLTPSQVFYPELLFPDEPMQVILNTQVDVDNGMPDETTQFPDYMEVEYIKIWQRDNGCCIPYKLYEATENLPPKTVVSDYIIAGNEIGIPNVNGNVTVQNGQSINFKAGNNISLKPGFVVEPGGVFNAEIENCSPLNQPGGENIVINNIPDNFSPDGDGWNDNLCVSVNGATSYTLAVDDNDWPYSRFYYAEEVQIHSDPVCVWDGSCNYTGNCWFYQKCSRKRKIHLTFRNCDNTLVQSKTINVDCFNNKSMQSSDSTNNSEYEAINLSYENYNDKFINNNFDDNFYFKVSPNPCKSNIQITYSINSNNKIALFFFNSSGLKVKEIYLDGGTNIKSMDLSDLSNGVYSYCVYEKDNLLIRDKIVVLK